MRATEPELSLPERGVAAHRGGGATHPENTLAAFRNAAALGAHMVELDVRACADGVPVVIHDATVDRTTGVSGRVSRLSLFELRQLDAGSHCDPRFAGERIPTLAAALDALPRDLWINVQIKRGEPVVERVAALLVGRDRVHQAFVACGNSEAQALREIQPQIRVCNLVRQTSRAAYVEHAIQSGAAFVQFHHARGAPEPELVARARDAGLRVNYFCDPTREGEQLAPLFEAGVDFALVDHLPRALAEAERLGVKPLPR